jgi:TolB-like protein/class 3 adenylate cyclase
VTGERVERRLAAVLAADVAGYSRLMGADEVGTLAALKAHRRDLVDPAIAEHKGRIVKTTGDGMLVEFASAVDAVNCAIAVQSKMTDRNRDAALKIMFRIGINVGDIIIDGDDIFGDGVNVAARVENECEPGGVCLSGNAFEHIRGKTAFAFDDLGERSLKNIDRPVRLYATRSVPAPAADVKPPAESTKTLAIPDHPSIAILPFQNMSGDSEQEYFADGVVEDITTALSRMRWLFVIARNSSFTYKGKPIDIKQVGRDLGVRYALEGSVRKAGGKLRLTGQLIETANGGHLWADRFDGDISDIFELQDRLVSSVVGAIAPRLEQAEIERAKQKPTDSLDAYDLYLRGLSCWNQWTKDGNTEATRLFYASIDHDPDFITPYGLVLSCYIMSDANRWSEDFDKNEIARLILRATDIGVDDPIALCWAGHASARFLDDIGRAISLVTRATELDTNLAVAWVRSGWVFTFAGNADLAIDSLNRAIRLNPIDPRVFLTYSAMATAHFVGRKNEEAVTWAEKALLVKPDWPPALRAAAASYAMLGLQDEAAKAISTLLKVAPTSRLPVGHRGFKRKADQEYWTNALRKAGLPE